MYMSADYGAYIIRAEWRVRCSSYLQYPVADSIASDTLLVSGLEQHIETSLGSSQLRHYSVYLAR
jgi:hypothetical protein